MSAPGAAEAPLFEVQDLHASTADGVEILRGVDLVVWPGDDLGDIHDPLAGLVLGPDRRARHVLVGGRPVVSDGNLDGVDLAAAHRDLAERARRLW